jgi:hypothetical protein
MKTLMNIAPLPSVSESLSVNRQGQVKLAMPMQAPAPVISPSFFSENSSFVKHPHVLETVPLFRHMMLLHVNLR